MSSSKLVTINCDGCLQWWDAGIADTAAEARRRLKRAGWKVNVRSREDPFARDFCPACVEGGRVQ